MNCPRCETKKLAERDRDGIQIDICSSCRGIWLDRGELEKLIARAGNQEGDGWGGRDDDDGDDGGRGDRRGRRGGFFASLGDIFD